MWSQLAEHLNCVNECSLSGAVCRVSPQHLLIWSECLTWQSISTVFYMNVVWVAQLAKHLSNVYEWGLSGSLGKASAFWVRSLSVQPWSGSVLFFFFFFFSDINVRILWVNRALNHGIDKYRIRPNYRTVRLSFSNLLGTLIRGKICTY